MIFVTRSKASSALALTALLGTLMLQACATGPTLVAAGAFKTQAPYTISLNRDWSDVTKGLFVNNAPKVSILTVDGQLLNRLYISEGLSPTDPLMINPMTGDRKENPAPRGKANMSLSEQIEFVSASIEELDYQKVQTSNPKPVVVGSAKGVRFEFTALTKEGLAIKGLAQAVSKNGLSYYVVYLAPSEHYYSANLPSVIATMDSAKL